MGLRSSHDHAYVNLSQSELTALLVQFGNSCGIFLGSDVETFKKVLGSEVVGILWSAHHVCCCRVNWLEAFCESFDF